MLLLKACTFVDFKDTTSAWSQVRHTLKELNSFESLDPGRSDLFAVVCFEVIDVAKLARLWDSLWDFLASCQLKPSVIVKSYTVSYVIEEPTEKKHAANCSARPSLAWIAMHYYCVLWILCRCLRKSQLTFEVLKRKLSNLKDIVEGRSVVIWPVPRLHPIPKLGHVVGLAFTSVDDPIVFAMIFCQKVCYLPISSS